MLPTKQGLFSLIPEAAVHISFAVNLARFLNLSKFTGKKPVLESLFEKAAGIRPETLLKRHFSTDIFM